MKNAVLLASLLLFTVSSAEEHHGKAAGGEAPRQKDWNPFASPFNFHDVRNTPQGFGSFPTLNAGNFLGGNSGFGGFGQPAPAAPNTNDNRRSGHVDNNRNGNRGGFGSFNGGFGTWPGFQTFSPNFVDFQNQFAQQFPSFWPAPSVVPVAPVTDTDAPVNVGVAAPIAPATTTTTTTTTQAPIPTTVAQVIAPAQTNGNSFTVTNRNCSVDGAVIGISQFPTDACGSVECQCFKGVYFCYSTCTPPPAGQTCTPTVPTGGADVCPTYDSCTPMANTTEAASQIFRCNGPVHPSVCWLYEILFGKLTEPLGFFESQSQVCPLSNQCICSSAGFVQPAQLTQADFKTPANNVVFPRTTPGNKGAFASS